MRSTLNTIVLTAVFASTLTAAYSNLIASGDGNTIYFQVGTGLVADRWFAVRNAGSSRIVESIDNSLADVSGSGTVLASSSFGERYCGFGGSTCFTAPSCSARFEIQGPGIQVSNSRRRTFIRLDRQGALAWIDQDTPCVGLGPPAPPPMNGLYESSSLRQIAPANGARLANQRYGRRVIGDRGRVLVFAGIQLSWLDAAGVHAIRHVASAFEAVVDSGGGNIAYVDAPFGNLHWIGTDDEDLGITGSAPALGDDGRILVFLAADDSLRAYDRSVRTVRRLGSDTYSSFTLGGNAVFAVTSDNRLVRIDLDSGAQSTWLQTFPEIQSADAPPLGVSVLCPLICYGTPDLGFALGPGMLLVLRGRFLDQPRWRARIAGVEAPLHVLSDKAAWILIPRDLSRTGETQMLEVYNPEHPIVFSQKVQAQDRVVACFGTLHQDFSRVVSADDPAAPGEIVHVFLTGLYGVESVPDGSPNPVDHLIAVMEPPMLVDPAAMDILFFGLAPGWIGLQQLDVRIRRAPIEQEFLWSGVNSFGCAAPPIATP
jgi:hypothetical protein